MASKGPLSPAPQPYSEASRAAERTQLSSLLGARQSLLATAELGTAAHPSELGDLPYAVLWHVSMFSEHVFTLNTQFSSSGLYNRGDSREKGSFHQLWRTIRRPFVAAHHPVQRLAIAGTARRGGRRRKQQCGLCWIVRPLCHGEPFELVRNATISKGKENRCGPGGPSL